MSDKILLNPNKYPFLETIKQSFPKIQQEYLTYLEDPNINKKILSKILRAKSS